MAIKTASVRKNSSKDLLFLLIIGGLYSLGTALSNTFVNIYLWKQSNDFRDLAIYHLAVVMMQPLIFIIAGRWAKQLGRVFVLRMGVFFLSFFYLIVLLIGTRATDHLLLLGALLGTGNGFYWLGFNVLAFEITEPETRDFFNGRMGALSSLGGMIGPLISGYVITEMNQFVGYSVAFGISLCLFALAVFLSFFF